MAGFQRIRGTSGGPPRGFLWWMARRWDAVQDLWWMLKPARFSLLTVIVGILALVASGQGREVLLATAEGDWIDSVMLFVAVLIWATFAWFWARVALQIDARAKPVHTDDPAEQITGACRLHALEKAVPRLLGVSAFVLLVIAYAIVLWLDGEAVTPKTRIRLWALMAAFAIGAAAFHWAIRVRREMLPERRPGMRLVESLFAVEPDATRGYSGFLALPSNARLYLALTIVAAILAFTAATLWPMGMARAVGPGFILIVAAATLIPFGTPLVSLSRNRDLPILTVIALLVVLFSLWNNNHEVRLLDREPAPRRNIQSAFQDQWAQGRPLPAEGQRSPVLIVATAGGASRAAYLTATVLGMMQDENPAFAQQVFAISGVSGGSLGAAVFQALVAASPDGSPKCQGPDRQESGFARCAQLILQQDFLGPTLAGLLYPDLVQRFLPFPVLPDRAAAIERAWEDAWVRVMGSETPVRLTDAFTEIRGRPEASLTSANWMPLLFLNGTSVATGSRIIASQAQFEGRELPDSLDMMGLLPWDVRLSTAVDMSTRFPYVEPAGVLPGTNGEPWDRIVDGGYFENFGATTAFDILRTLRSSVEEFDHRYRPIVVQISNDSGYKGVDSEEERWQRIKQGDNSDTPEKYLHETKDPLLAFAETRGARGRYAVKALERTLVETKVRLRANEAQSEPLGVFIEFRIFSQAKEQSGEIAAKDPPLGWRLSQAARIAIDRQALGADANNAESFAKLRAAMH